MKSASNRIILITGEPGFLRFLSFESSQIINFYVLNNYKGVGKTTLIKKVFERLKKNSHRPIYGFYTEEVRNDLNARIGFDVIDINQPEKKLPLARVK